MKRGLVHGTVFHQQNRTCFRHTEDILKTDNHGFIYFIDENGKRVDSIASISFWDEERKNSYDEELFSINYDELENYSLYGEFWTSDGYETGDWEVTFRME